jgi:hypothetical protein
VSSYDFSTPEEAPGTTCFRKQEQAFADASCTGNTCKKFVFAVQGQWKQRNVEPMSDPNTGKLVSNTAIDLKQNFNYMIYFPSTQSYAWMNNDISSGPQYGSISRQRVGTSADGYPRQIWCTTPK